VVERRPSAAIVMGARIGLGPWARPPRSTPRCDRRMSRPTNAPSPVRVLETARRHESLPARSNRPARYAEWPGREALRGTALGTCAPGSGDHHPIDSHPSLVNVLAEAEPGKNGEGSRVERITATVWTEGRSPCQLRAPSHRREPTRGRHSPAGLHLRPVRRTSRCCRGLSAPWNRAPAEAIAEGAADGPPPQGWRRSSCGKARSQQTPADEPAGRATTLYNVTAVGQID